MPRKFLIINPFGIGDVIFSTPLISILKKKYPDSFIGYVCNKRTSRILASNPMLDRVFIYEKDDYRKEWQLSKMAYFKKVLSVLSAASKEKFDTAIDLSLGYHYSLLLWLIGVRRRIGFNYRNRGRFATAKIDIDGFCDKHVVEYYLDLLRLLDINPKEYQIEPKIYVAQQNALWAEEFLRDNDVGSDDIIIGLIPGCGASWGADAKFRRWHCKGFAEVADRLIDRYGAQVILFGNTLETGICENVRSQMKNRSIFMCGKTTTDRFVSLLERCGLVVTNDGGPLHMAVALGVSTVSIFGPVDEKVYGPYSPRDRHIVVSNKSLSCRPCYRKFKYKLCPDQKCLSSIEVDRVVDAAEKLLANKRRS